MSLTISRESSLPAAAAAPPAAAAAGKSPPRALSTHTNNPPEPRKREYKDMEEKEAGDQHAKVDVNTVSTIAGIGQDRPPRLCFSGRMF